MERQAVIDHYKQHPDVSVLVVGAGINGIGTFRDLALQGVDGLLVDKGDFCSGASAASSRMAHGGIRYLETGEFRLVRESLTERNRLLKNAPHAVEPYPISVPVYGWLSGILNAPLKFMGWLKKPNERGAVVIKLGMMMYDWFTRNNRLLPTHEFLLKRDALAKHPHLNPSLVGLGTYYDTLMPAAERIGLELALDAETANPKANALNYVKLVGREGDSVQLQDEVSGETFSVKPGLVINATGAWIDFANQAMQRKTHFIGGTKGSHIIVDNPDIMATLNGSAVYFENKDGRMCIFAPLGDKVMIGATDIRIEDPDEAVCTDDEINYFMTFTEHVMPELRFDRSQVVFHFSGVRPLAYSDVEFTGLISRDHSIRVIEPDDDIPFPVYALVGGKWTTFRQFSEEAADKALAYLGKSRQRSTADVPIGGGADYPADEAAKAAWVNTTANETGLTPERVETLFKRYGTRAKYIASFIAQGADDPIITADYSQREMMYLAQNEKVAHLNDLIIRRTLIGMLGYIDDGVLVKLGEAVGAALGWSVEQIHSEIQATAQHLIAAHGVPAGRLQRSLNPAAHPSA